MGESESIKKLIREWEHKFDSPLLIKFQQYGRVLIGGMTYTDCTVGNQDNFRGRTFTLGCRSLVAPYGPEICLW